MLSNTVSRFGLPSSVRLARPFTTTVRRRNGAMSAAETDTEAVQNANTSGITPDSLKITLTEKLGAQYVAIDDMSGLSSYLVSQQRD